MVRTCLEYELVVLKGSTQQQLPQQHIDMSAMDKLQLGLSQRVGPSDYGCDPYQVVVSTANGDRLVHEYCLYSSAYGGPVRPDAVTGLRAEPTGGGRATIKWEWSENSFDLASPGAYFARDVIVEEGRLAWEGKVRKRLARPHTLDFRFASRAAVNLGAMFTDIGTAIVPEIEVATFG